MKKIFSLILAVLLAFTIGLIGGCNRNIDDTPKDTKDDMEKEMAYPDNPQFLAFDQLMGQRNYFEQKEMYAHDPSIFQDTDGTFYVFSTHGNGDFQVQIRKSTDLINFETLPCAISNDELTEGKKYTGQKKVDVWAPDVIKGSDGKYWLYYSMSTFGSQTSYIGLAKADKVTGPYYHDSMVITSKQGDSGPNCIDPNIIKDPKSQKLYMVYGSFAGGIYIKELDASTGRALDNNFGVRLVGRNNAWMAIEGPYIVYNPKFKNYYLFLSYGSLSSDYNIRVARSSKIDGEYVDADGNNLSLMTDLSQNYGTKILGGYAFTQDSKNELKNGWMAPGHNSVINTTKGWFLVHHVRTYRYGEGPFMMQVRKMVFNEDGWPVVSPFRYAGEVNNTYTSEKIAGQYQFIFQGKDTSSIAKTAVLVNLEKDGHVSSDEFSGQYSVAKDGKMTMYIGDIVYKGFIQATWDNDANQKTLAISLLGAGESVIAKRI